MAAETRPVIEGPRARTRVLMVEGDARRGELVRRQLEEELEDLELRGAATLREALAHLDRGAGTCVLLNLSLADSRGLKTFLRLKQHAPDAAVVVLTPPGELERGVASVHAGAQANLVHGRFGAAELGGSVRQAIERQALAIHLNDVSRRVQLLAAELLTCGRCRDVRDGEADPRKRPGEDAASRDPARVGPAACPDCTPLPTPRCA